MPLEAFGRFRTSSEKVGFSGRFFEHLQRFRAFGAMYFWSYLLGSAVTCGHGYLGFAKMYLELLELLLELLLQLLLELLLELLLLLLLSWLPRAW